MARTAVKATYALDVETMRTLERMADRWAVSKSEALRRAIRAAAAAETTHPRHHLDRLDRVQRAVGLDAAGADAWVREVRAERRATSKGKSGEKARR